MTLNLFLLSSIIPYSSFLNIITLIIDVLVVWFLIYWVIKIVRNNSRTIQIFKGIVLIILARVIAAWLGLNTVSWLTDSFISWGFLAVIVIFQPEIRGILERLGKSKAFGGSQTLTPDEKEELVKELMKAVPELSNHKTGALISLEQSMDLGEFIKSGTKLNSDISAELLVSIFQTNTPLHDGAVIIRGSKVTCASAYFPPTNFETPSRYGARHRAAKGVSEITDAITIVVSEETGDISIARDGELRIVDIEGLRSYLNKYILNITKTELTTSYSNELFEDEELDVVDEQARGKVLVSAVDGKEEVQNPSVNKEVE
ncbi:MAG: diadenylate cyclase CdaA [Erysipelotrichaceae bacterium]